MKIYVVTSGEYSDYHIITATTDKALAERIREKFSRPNDWEEAQIEEYEDAEIYLRQVWYVNFNKDGTVDCVKDVSDGEFAYSLLNKCMRGGNHGDLFGRDCVCVYVAAGTEEGAIKTAAEKRAEFLADESGIV